MQQMIVDHKSWHYRYNCYIYGDGTMNRVNNGCEYFWRTVLACILSGFVGLIKLAEIIHCILPDFPEVHMPEISDDTINRIHSLIISSILLAIIIATIIPCMYGYGWGVLKVYAIVSLGVCGIVGICFLVIIIKEYIDSRPKKEKPIKEKNPNMVWQMVKAKKNKYCPKLVIT